MIENTPPQNTVVLSYFMFTSLSTVGFGDLHPRGDFERLACAFILLFGVAIFSYIMGIFIEILEQFQNYNAELDQGDALNQFLGIITRKNGNEILPLEMKNNIESYFDYRWKNDHNQAVSEENDVRLFNTLPVETREQLYINFLFYDFLAKFKRNFSIPNMWNQR